MVREELVGMRMASRAKLVSEHDEDKPPRDPWCFYCQRPVYPRSRCPNNVSEIHNLIERAETSSDRRAR
jgi:hypothetical protein